MGGSKLWMAGVAALGVVTAAGCQFPEPADAAARREALRRDGEDMAQAADALEDRLLGNQANLLLWDELARRHKTVSVVACRNHTEHFDEMVRLLDAQQQRARKLKRSRHVAGVGGPRDGTVVSAALRTGSKRRN